MIDSSPKTKTELARVSRLKPLLDIYQEVEGSHGAFDIRLGESSIFGIHQEGPIVHLSQFEVYPYDIQRYGVGTRLLSCFFKYCQSIGVEAITSEVTNPTALHIRKRLMGEEAIHFYENVEGEMLELPMTIDQACASIERALDHRQELYEQGALTDSINTQIDTKVYLKDVEMSNWEMPVPLEV